MRLVTKMSLVAMAVMTLAACQKEAEQKPAVLDTDEAKQSYSLGVSVGRYLDSTLEDYSKLGLTVDRELILRGVQDAVANKASLSDEEVQAMMTALEEKFREKQTAMVEAEAAKAIEAGKTYLEENAKKEGVTVTESGLQYEVLQAAEGAKPAATDTVKVHYTGTLTDGTKFDSSVDRGEPAQFPLNRVIAGWTEGVQLMNVGSRFKFTIPAELAYGERDMGVIKPNSVLVFEVELLEIVETAPAEAQ
ncbi:FKBP-type peptidyl-prolyl cis-trans isomerase [Rheinheimera baltica]|uniref:Peptidyl-prolyl cis-trans isomerase n=1 Tax=Rheinheimera baltica TaxID=67576 RepID=A0ABT9HVM8_9GAMM|nr:FKBP-type peptidyl-prolyl cis-trans isomerase [Rheinheimera baltica]MDP5135185.1 FKBP-type peptidyl-prolyl cis-trans isomerase [Rheinheimera baltica]MDP5143540.1 FKBP-type peptidyl-prolyl cis-trans isomerase [Rheinheimera baltica]MDP5151106.1 FKBP-type peptidyl-prolyl cis-trans isomerase [Rheinheimera baltica]MDP5190000.1 FKBP-type peptidyl-prolyl cis-trans isomerase [Rheinheimera baltica]